MITNFDLDKWLVHLIANGYDNADHPAVQEMIVAMNKTRDECRLDTLTEEDRNEAIAYAIGEYANDSDDAIAVDSDAMLSVSDDGVWVQGWLWVPNVEE